MYKVGGFLFTYHGAGRGESLLSDKKKNSCTPTRWKYHVTKFTYCIRKVPVLARNLRYGNEIGLIDVLVCNF